MIAAPAPAVLDAAPATTSAAPAANSAAPSGFDAILLLQSLAATTETLAGFEASDTTEALATEDGDEEDSDDDLEASLAFLTSLIHAAPPRQSANDSGEFAAGAGNQGAAGEEAGASLALALKADTGFALAADAIEKSEAPTSLAAVPPELLETHAGGGDPSQNLARAAELLAQAQRPTAEVDKPAVTTHARDPRWADDFGARVSLMVRAGESAASLQMTPVDLGPVEVNVTVKDSQATIHFSATQAETRALIEASLPRLRELLASQGFNLMDASVSSGFSRSQQQEFASGSRGGNETDAVASEVSPTRRQLGLLDLYA